MIFIDWNTYIIGVRLFYWVYLFATVVFTGLIFAYFKREAIKKVYYEVRYPEKIIIAKLIYPNGMIRSFYRLIPESKSIDLEGGSYIYDSTALLQENDAYAYQNKNGLLVLKIDGKEYNLDDKLKIKGRWDKYPQIYYLFGIPLPVAFTFDQTDKNPLPYFNAAQLKNFKESTIMTQIYKSLAESNLIIFVLVLVFITLVISGVVLTKVMGWLK